MKSSALSLALAHLLSYGNSDVRANEVGTNATIGGGNGPEHIINGTPLNPRDRPYLVVIGGGNLCGGSLIAPGLVLSAAHCFECLDYHISAGLCSTEGEFFVPSDYVEFNRYDRSDPNENTVKINLCRSENSADCDPDEAYVVRHPDYITHPEGPTTFETLENDVVLIVLPNDLPEAVAEIDPVALNRDPSLPVVGEELEVMGWGLIEDGGLPSAIPLTTNLRYVTNDECQEPPFLWPTGDITDNMLCAVDVVQGTAACQGDSGGPIVRYDDQNQPMQVGVASFVGDFGCADPDYPNVYARVSVLLDWIEGTACKETGDFCPSAGKSGKSAKRAKAGKGAKRAKSSKASGTSKAAKSEII